MHFFPKLCLIPSLRRLLLLFLSSISTNYFLFKNIFYLIQSL
jgi:hypothetical protein